MTIAEVLASVDGGAGSEAVVRAALAVGRAFDAHVDLLHVEASAQDAIPLVSDGLTGPAIAQILENAEQAAKAKAKAAHDVFEKLCLFGDSGADKAPPVLDAEETPPRGRFTVTWRQLGGRVDDILARRGRLADLIVMAKASDDAGLTAALESALFDSGRPVLLAPAETGTELGHRIALAWDGSREAVRAAAAALPFLGQAHEVLVLTARVKGGDADPSDLGGYLARHGVAADCRWLEPGNGSVAERVLEAAQTAHCDLLVMGAYGHSRLRELVLGGATDSILRTASLPVLLAH